MRAISSWLAAWFVLGTAVTATLSPLARRRTQARESVYRLLALRPPRSWTVAALCGELDGSTRQSPNAVRDVLYVLLADDALTIVKSQRGFTVELTRQGEVALRTLLAKWDHVSGTIHVDPHLSDTEVKFLDAGVIQLVQANRTANHTGPELHFAGAHGPVPTYPPYDPASRAQSARDRAEQARQRAVELHNHLIQLAAGNSRTTSNSSSGNEHVDKAYQHAMQARRHATTALQNSASAHERAIQLHQRLAQMRPDHARIHKDAAAEHRRAAQADRIRAARDAPDA